MKKWDIIVCCIMVLGVTLTPISMAQSDTEVRFNLSGNVYTNNGELAGTTYIKVVPMQSVTSTEGTYLFSGVPPGEQTVRAYFMNNGHTVSYRKIFFSSDTILDWYEGKNWITTKVYDDKGTQIKESDTLEVELLNSNDELIESKSTDYGYTEFGPHNTEAYHTIKTTFTTIDSSEHYIHFKMENGGPSGPDYPHVNNFDIYHGKNSRYGFITDNNGTPMAGVEVHTNESSFISNSDGFFLLQNLTIGTTQTMSFLQSGIEVIPSFEEFITQGPGWRNISSSKKVELPENVTFTSQISTSPLSPFKIEWKGGNFTDYYSLYSGQVNENNLIYRGYSTSFTYNPVDSGTITFNIVANNSNGSTLNFNPLKIIFLAENTHSELWSPGMSWNYSVHHTPEYFQNKTYTVIGAETITDAFNQERETYLLRVSDKEYEEKEKAYRWIDSKNLLSIKTYWVDDPSVSSYFQEGTLGWEFTTENGEKTDLFSSNNQFNLHFNRTNVIGVPGHPDGYDDTYNTVTLNEDVSITTAAGTFSTKHFVIRDNKDGIISWELWYNETVRNWVKIIDRLPGSHSDQVNFELTSYEMPITPKFITEEENLSTDNFEIQWTSFPSASKYQLILNGEVVYEGTDTSHEFQNQDDGKYIFQLNAIVGEDIVFGDEIIIGITLVLDPPIVETPSQTINSGDPITISWHTERDIDWFSVIVQDPEGEIKEVYNGTENSTILNDLSYGQNRIRILAGLNNGKSSDYSPSIFITIEQLQSAKEKQLEKEDDSIPWLPIFSNIIMLGITAILIKRRDWSDEI